MVWGAIASGLGSLAGGLLGGNAAKKGADAQAAAAQAATAEQRRQFDLTRSDMLPWMNAGTDALARQNAFLNGDWSGFQNSPDYRWAVDQGTRALDRGAAARGNLTGGGADADRIAFGQGLATQYAGNYWNRLAGLSNTGQQTGAQLGQFGANAANNIGQNLVGAGNARASSYAAQANAWNDALGGITGAFGQWYGGRR